VLILWPVVAAILDTNFTFFVPIWNSKWRLRQDLFNIGPHG
jgi:hypothetical protein